MILSKELSIDIYRLFCNWCKIKYETREWTEEKFKDKPLKKYICLIILYNFKVKGNYIIGISLKI